MTIDILLSYFDNPGTLDCWLSRLLTRTDLPAFSQQAIIVICDTGTPRDRVPETISVLNNWSGAVPIKYIRVDTEALRASAPQDAEVRPTPAVYNTALKSCSGELVMFTILSHIPGPTYFADVFNEHEKRDNLLLQPRQFRLDWPDYWKIGYEQSFSAVIEHPVFHWNGMPDWSVRRKWLDKIGGWDEDYVCWSMADIDLCCRLTGRTDLDITAQEWIQSQNPNGYVSEFTNLGLQLRRPFHAGKFFSLICNGYNGHVDLKDSKRAQAVKVNMDIFMKKWGVVKREGKLELPYEVVEI